MCLHVNYNVYNSPVEAIYLNSVEQEAERNCGDICLAHNL